MTWTTIPNGDVDPESPITTSLMTALRDNPAAIAAGDSGAPKVTDSAFNTNSINGNKLINNSVGASQIATGGVHTSELNTSTASTSTTSASNFTMTGGMYVFAPQWRVSTGSGYGYGTSSTANMNFSSTSFVTSMSIGASGNTAYCQWRYVAASPPHDMGDGDIPLFVYAVIDNVTGDVISLSIADEPVWLANGPTIAMPDFWRTEKDGTRKKFKVVKDVPASFAALSEVERMVAIAELPDTEVEITEEMVHADMDIIPHPFTGNDLGGQTVVMLDPVSDTVRDLSHLDRAGEDVHKIIRDKYIIIGNTQLNRVTPAGLLIPSTTWKKTK